MTRESAGGRRTETNKFRFTEYIIYLSFVVCFHYFLPLSEPKQCGKNSLVHIKASSHHLKVSSTIWRRDYFLLRQLGFCLSVSASEKLKYFLQHLPGLGHGMLACQVENTNLKSNQERIR